MLNKPPWPFLSFHSLSFCWYWMSNNMFSSVSWGRKSTISCVFGVSLRYGWFTCTSAITYTELWAAGAMIWSGMAQRRHANSGRGIAGRRRSTLCHFDAAGYDLEMIPIRAAGSIGTCQIHVLWTSDREHHLRRLNGGVHHLTVMVKSCSSENEMPCFCALAHLGTRGFSSLPNRGHVEWGRPPRQNGNHQGLGGH